MYKKCISMKNHIKAIETCFRLGESTLKHISQELKENPYDRKALKSMDESLELLVPLIEEAEFIHKNIRIASIGKEIYDAYASNPKYNVTQSDNLEPLKYSESALAKRILIIEDQESPLEALENAVDKVMPKYFPSYNSEDREVVKCYNQAENKIRNYKYDFIFLDHRMPLNDLGDLERTNFDSFSSQLVNIGYSLIPIIKEYNSVAITIGTSSLSREELREFESPKHKISKMWGEAERDLENILRELKIKEEI